MNGQQFPINPKWQRELDIASVKLQTLYLKLQLSWKENAPQPPTTPQEPPKKQAQQQPPAPY